jgi:hypothetical protein
MSANPQEVQAPNQAQEAQKATDKELNFRKQEEYFKRQLEQERQGRLLAEQQAAELKKAQEKARPVDDDDDDNDDEPYIDKKRLKKEQVKFGKQIKTETQAEIQQAVQAALSEERKNNWLKTNPDFYEVMQHAEKFAEKDPELAETILAMPEGFERQKLVYKNIKALGIHNKEDPKESIQAKIDQNRKGPYYQPSGVGAAPYGNINLGRDVSPEEGNNAYKRMQDLKKRLRI